jgi:hypothetical protein
VAQRVYRVFLAGFLVTELDIAHEFIFKGFALPKMRADLA